MRYLLPLVALSIIAAGVSAVAAQEPNILPALAREIAREAYIWGYPLVLMDVTRQVLTNHEVASNELGLAPINQFAHARKFPSASFHTVVRPNFDTLYSTAWLDLGPEPMVITMPKTDRYHVFEMMDAWSEVFADLGTRMTGGEGGNYLIVGRDWKGEAPEGMEILRSPTDIVWVLGRIQTDGAADYDFVHKIQDQIKLVPLSNWGKSYSPPNGNVNPKIDMKKAPMSVVDEMNGETFFTAMAEAMKTNPPHIHDQGLVERMKRLGLEPGKSLDFKSLPVPVQQALNDAPVAALKVIRERSQRLGSPVNGWNVLNGAIGYFGADYLVRAATALLVLAANRPEDAVYAIGEPLSGGNRYVLHFPKDQTPSVTGFWSITLYDERGFAVENALNRYAIGDRDHLKFDDDGSLTLNIQHDAPGADKESNWLPAPEGVFSLTLRCYSPAAQIISGDWTPPAVTQAK